MHTGVYRARPDVGAVVHGHPPYATALGATVRSSRSLTHDGDPVRRRRRAFDEPGSDRRRRARACASPPPRRRRAVLMRNHGVLVVGKDVPWAVLTAVTLERAARLQSIASTLGDAAADPGELALRLLPVKYRDEFVEEYWAAWLRQRRPRAAEASVEIALSVNGREVVREVAPQELLLDFLRDRARPDRRQALVRRPGVRRLHGARRRVPVSSCCYLAADAHGREVHDHRGPRRAAGVRRASRTPSRATPPSSAASARPDAAHRQRAARRRRARRARRTIRHGLAGNLCRCTGLRGILEAVVRARRGSDDDHRPERPASRPQVGRSQPRRDAREKLRGEAAVRRRHARPADAARQGAAQPDRARAGSSRSTPRRRRRCPASSASSPAPTSTTSTPTTGHAIKDRPIVAIDKVRFAGEPVAAVAAETEAAAAAAVELIEVEYEELPVVGDARGRDSRPSAPLVTRAGRSARPLPRPRRAPAARRQRLLPLPDRPRRGRGGVRARRTSWSRASTPSRPSTSTRWRRTP